MVAIREAQTGLFSPPGVQSPLYKDLHNFSPAAVIPEAVPHAPTTIEQAIVKRVVLGWEDRKIGEELGIPKDTVQLHLGKVGQKFGVSGRVGIAIVAVTRSYVSLEEAVSGLDPTRIDTLTNREIEVLLSMIRGGSANRAIAADLGISKETVGYHMKEILSKLGVRSRVSAALLFLARRGDTVEDIVKRLPSQAVVFEEKRPALNTRQQRVIRLAALGYTNKEIADQVSISEDGVKFHMSKILSVLQTGTRLEAVLKAVEQGIVIPEEAVEKMNLNPLQVETLTQRDIKILQAMAKTGLSSDAIGEHLGISLETVKHHLKSIFKKLDVNNQIQATMVFLAYKRQIERAERNRTELIELFGTHYERLARYIASRIGSIDEAEDLASEVFIKALQAVDSYRDKGAMVAWLFRIASNIVVDYFRDLHRKQTSFYIGDSFDLEDKQEQHEDLYKEEDFARLREAVEKLSDKQQRVLALRFGDELSSEEVSKVVETTPGAVREMQSTAVAKLRAIMGSTINAQDSFLKGDEWEDHLEGYAGNRGTFTVKDIACVTGRSPQHSDMRKAIRESMGRNGELNELPSRKYVFGRDTFIEAARAIGPVDTDRSRAQKIRVYAKIRRKKG